MTKEIAKILQQRIVDAELPYLTTIAGLVQTVVYAEENATGGKMLMKMPVSVDTNIEQCGSANEIQEKAIVPDSAQAGILYFEENGSSFDKSTAHGDSFKSALTLVCWLNKKRITGDKYTSITTQVIRDIKEAFGRNPFNEMPFCRIQVMIDKVQAQDANVFSPYSYDEAVSQYLMPPYEFFALQITVKYVPVDACVQEIVMSPDNCATPPEGDYATEDYSGNNYSE